MRLNKSGKNIVGIHQGKVENQGQFLATPMNSTGIVLFRKVNSLDSESFAFGINTIKITLHTVATDTRYLVFVVCYRHPKITFRAKFSGFRTFKFFEID